MAIMEREGNAGGRKSPKLEDDALLLAARVSDRVYTLAGELARGSIRDIMWRSQALCERLYALGRLKKKSRVLVVGGGIGGMTCAVSATKLGGEVTLVERSNLLARRQAQCLYRSVCPTVSEFPLEYWYMGRYPIHGHRAKIGWGRGECAVVASDWHKQFYNLVVRSGRLKIFLRSRFLAVDGWEDDDRRPATAKFSGSLFGSGGPVEHDREFDLVFLCLGAGDERLAVGDGMFRSAAFWEYDDPLFDFDDPARCEPFGRTPVLIVGEGDGGLSDFVSLSTGERQFAKTLAGLNFNGRELADIQRLRHALVAYQQVGHASEPSAHRHLARVQDESMRVVDRMWDRESLRRRVASLVRPDGTRPWLQVAVKCYHFSYGYIANRIVAQLFARHLAEELDERNGGLAPFRVGVEVERLAGVRGHDCRGSAKSCSVGWHSAHFARYYCPGTKCNSGLIQGRQRDAGAVREPAASQSRLTVSTDPAPHEYRRVLLRINAGDYSRVDYGLPESIVSRATVTPEFRVGTPVYPL